MHVLSVLEAIIVEAILVVTVAFAFLLKSKGMLIKP
jgi:hypothetical protein